MPDESECVHEVNVTDFRGHVREYLALARKEGQITIQQGKGVRFHVIPAQNCTEPSLAVLFY